jgi:hypothetical protein
MKKTLLFVLVVGILSCQKDVNPNLTLKDVLSKNLAVSYVEVNGKGQTIPNNGLTATIDIAWFQILKPNAQFATDVDDRVDSYFYSYKNGTFLDATTEREITIGSSTSTTANLITKKGNPFGTMEIVGSKKTLNINYTDNLGNRIIMKASN